MLIENLASLSYKEVKKIVDEINVEEDYKKEGFEELIRELSEDKRT